MTAVYIILGIAAALFLLSLLRVGVHIAFGDELRVTAMAGPMVKWFMAMRKRRKAAEKSEAAAKAAAEKEAQQASGQGAGYTTT